MSSMNVLKCAWMAVACVLTASALGAAGPFSQEAYLKPSDPVPFGTFGTDVALRGNKLVVGNWSAGGGPYNRAYYFARSGTEWAQKQIVFFPGNGSASLANFGYRVALLDDWLAVVASREPNFTTNANLGFVYLFKPTGANGDWEVAGKIGSTLVIQGNYFGESIAMTPGRMAVGQLSGRGSAHIYSLVGGQWTLESVLMGREPVGVAFSFDFGRSIALSKDGEWLVVGAPKESSKATGVNGVQNDVTSPGSGAAYIYRRFPDVQGQGPGWILQAYLKASNTDPNDQFGVSVAIDETGSTVVVGAPFEDSVAEGVNGSQQNPNVIQPASVDRGAAYVFGRAAGGTNWTQTAYLKPFGLTGIFASAVDQFGNDVAVQDDLVIVGAHNSSRSAAYVFERGSDGAWATRARLTNSVPGSVRFTQSMAIDGNTAVFSAHQDSTTANRSGAVYVFTGFASAPPLPNPTITYQSADDSVELTFFGTVGQSYLLQRSPDLLGWTTIQTVVANAEGQVEYQDANPPAEGAFYRIVLP
ncbi:MAG: hypothetical protein JNN07_25185 [Verrucomicrobiales bacterium]|nr:hypothetical protein [Verrucomicrobiales bacterium]